MEFKQYDNPEKAKRIFEDYIGDFMTEGLLNEIIKITDSCTTCINLDAELGCVFAFAEVKNKKGKKAFSDIDSGGYWANAMRILEGD